MLCLNTIAQHHDTFNRCFVVRLLFAVSMSAVVTTSLSRGRVQTRARESHRPSIEYLQAILVLRRINPKLYSLSRAHSLLKNGLVCLFDCLGIYEVWQICTRLLLESVMHRRRSLAKSFD